MANPDWLLMLGRDGTIESVEGGAPESWVSRRVEECGVPDEVKSAARRLVRDLARPSPHSLVRRVRVEPHQPEAPSYTLLAVEGILLRPAEVAFEPLIRGALQPLVRQAEGSGVSLRIEAQADLPARISIDAAKIAWAVTALVGNALRYVRRGSATRPGGDVGVMLAHSAAQDMVSITVEDDGPGIPADVQARLLVSSADCDRGTGVSLLLVHEVVGAHGGGMVIKSSTAPEDRGTAVTLWIPVRS
jgi:signal transduction histidine kinase